MKTFLMTINNYMNAPVSTYQENYHKCKFLFTVSPN